MNRWLWSGVSRWRAPLAAAALLTFGIVAAGATAAGAAAGDAPGARAADSTLQVLIDTPTGWTGNASTCAAGTESAQSLQATLDSVNLLRAAAGLAPVSFDPQLNASALAGALMMRAADELSHHPDPSWPCYSAAGAEAAGHGNLYLGRKGAGAMLGYVLDDGVESLGHRRWVLDPTATVMGSGSTDRTNVLWVISDGPEREIPPDAVVAWPPPGWVTAVWVPHVWSVAVGDSQSAWGDAGEQPRVIGTPTVQMTMDGQPLPATPASLLAKGYGTGHTLAWVPQIPDNIADSGDHVFAVTVTGLQVRVSDDPATYRDLPVAYQVGVTATPSPNTGKPPAGGAGAMSVTVAAANRYSKLRVDLDPDGFRGGYRFTVLRQRADGTWAKAGTYRTKGRAHRRTINLKRGTYTVVVPAQRGYAAATSGVVVLQR